MLLNVYVHTYVCASNIMHIGEIMLWRQLRDRIICQCVCVFFILTSHYQLRTYVPIHWWICMCILHCTTLHYIVLHCTTLYHIVLHCTTLYYIVLRYAYACRFPIDYASLLYVFCRHTVVHIHLRTISFLYI